MVIAVSTVKKELPVALPPAPPLFLPRLCNYWIFL